MSYGYDLAGNMTSETYPSGKVIESEYDAAGRIAGVKRQANGMYYAGGPVGSGAMQYAAHGAVTSMRLGNGRIERTTFNSRLQPTQIKLDSNTFGSDTLRLDDAYGTTTNNGNVMSQTITVPNPSGGAAISMTQNYSYDALNRLATANENSGSVWSQTYDYDRYGNRSVRSGSYIPPANASITPQSTTSTDFSRIAQLTQKALDHIVLRHWATSGAKGAGKFLAGITGKEVKSLIEDAVQKGANSASRFGREYVHDFGRQIGTDIKGRVASRLKVVVEASGEVVTAYPIK